MMLRKVQAVIPYPIIYNLNTFQKYQPMKYLNFIVSTCTVNLDVEI